MVELGTVTEFIKGKQTTLKKVRIGWELPEEQRVFDIQKGEQPLVISKEYTLSMNEKSNLRKDLKSWRGKDFTEDEAKCFDITKLLGAQCMLNIIHKPSLKDPTRIYEQIAGITPLPKSIKCPPQINKTLLLSYDNFDHDLFDSMPDFIKTKMRGSQEFISLQNPQAKQIDENEVFYSDEVIDDGLPF